MLDVASRRKACEDTLKRTPAIAASATAQGGESLETFLIDFEGVTREQAAGVLELARKGLLEERSAA